MSETELPEAMVLQAAEVDDLKARLRMIVSHATGGHWHEQESLERSINDICVEISAHNNRIWKHAQESALTAAGVTEMRSGVIEECARIAEGFSPDHAPDEKGWSYFNPDTGPEWTPQHPWRSGECPDAASVTRMTFGRWANKQGYLPIGIANAIRALQGSSHE